MKSAMKSSPLYLASLMGALILAGTLAIAQDPGGGPPVSVLTWHNDTARTGQNLNEGTLLYGPTNGVSTSNFGQLCSAQLDGQVYAQPLVVSNIKDVNGNLQNVVFVVTQNDSLYAFNAPPPSTGSTCSLMTFHVTTQPPNPLAFLSTGATNGQSAADCGQLGDTKCGTIGPKIGILGTPVVYAVAGPPAKSTYNSGMLYIYGLKTNCGK
jgi:hypothetical protein